MLCLELTTDNVPSNARSELPRILQTCAVQKHNFSVPNNTPPSPFTSMPNCVKCIIIAPPIKPSVRVAPAQTVLGINNKIPAISSKTPIPILPNGSKPTFSKKVL